MAKKHYTCKGCGQVIYGRPVDVARHAKLECPETEHYVGAQDEQDEPEPKPRRRYTKRVSKQVTLESLLARRTELQQQLHDVSHQIDLKLSDLGLEWSVPENDPVREDASEVGEYHREKSA